jgi:4-hydroxy-tetrahydrodipicolinate synthase
MIGTGCDAIFINSTTGRGPWWSRSDRIELCHTVANHVADDIPIFAGCMATGLSEMLDYAQAYAGAGADIAVITAPGYYTYGVAEIEAIFRRFADNSPLPVLIYDIPVCAGMKLDLDMVLRLADHENVIGLKDSTSDMERFRTMLEALGDRDDLYLLQGKEHLLADSLLAGCSGFVVSLTHINPQAFVGLAQAALSGNTELAQAIQDHITELMNLVNASFDKRPPSSTVFHFMDYALRQRGVCENIMLPHEQDCPDWLLENVQQGFEICQKAAALVP